MKRQPQWLQPGICSHLSRLDVNTAETIQMPSTCSWESSSLHQSSGPQMVLLAWWGPCKKLAFKREKGLEYIVFTKNKKNVISCSYLQRFKSCQRFLHWIDWLVGVLAVKERLRWGWWKGCRVWRGALHSRNGGGLESGKSEPSLQCVQGLYRWQPCATGWFLDVVKSNISNHFLFSRNSLWKIISLLFCWQTLWCEFAVPQTKKNGIYNHFSYSQSIKV